MAKDIYECNSLKVTSFAGAIDELQGGTRMRLQFTVTSDSKFDSLGYGDVRELRDVIDRWLLAHKPT